MTVAAQPVGIRRLTAGPARTLSEHLRQHGSLPEPGVALIDEIDRAGLYGRGGGAFPTARKMDAVAAARRGAIVVANAAEGEPMSAKDRWLVARTPHLVLDGAVLAAQAVGANELVLCIRGDALEAWEQARIAVAEREDAGLLPVVVHTVATPPVYLAGEESALVRFLNGGPALPTFVPPRPYERGVSRRPTLVQNVETLAHIALIARHGARWFRKAGTANDPGTALVTMSGAVARPGVYEVELSDPVREGLAAAGGATEPVRGALVGGYFGAWTGPATGHPAPRIGAGAIAILPESACPVAETARVAAYLAREAAGQCGPCTNGLGAVAASLADIARGTAGPTVMEDLERWSAIMPGRGACHHPDGAIGFVASALTTFPSDFAEHLRNGPCARCARPPVLPTP
jgi:NADH:ubiquinone oxidoreductase subunit F (NADH-binding)